MPNVVDIRSIKLNKQPRKFSDKVLKSLNLLFSEKTINFEKKDFLISRSSAGPCIYNLFKEDKEDDANKSINDLSLKKFTIAIKLGSSFENINEILSSKLFSELNSFKSLMFLICSDSSNDTIVKNGSICFTYNRIDHINETFDFAKYYVLNFVIGVK